MPDYEIVARARVARTFQNIRLFPGMTVLENLIVAQHNPLMAASGLDGAGPLRRAPLPSRPRPGRVERAKYWLDKVGLIDRADDPAGDLPYGAQRRLEIARAMCTEPVLLCLDEPAAGLNPRESADLTAFLKSIQAEHGTSILLIEHDMSVVMEISDHVVVLEYGQQDLRRPARARAQRPQGDRRLPRRRGRGGREGRSGDRAMMACRAPSSPLPLAGRGRGWGHASTSERRESHPTPNPSPSRGGEPVGARGERRHAMSEPLLAVRGVKSFYGNIMALKGVALDVHEGEIVTLIGANGAGKSTLMMTIFGNPRAREGRILYRGRDITELPTHEIARLRIAQAPGGPAHLPAHDGAREPADGRRDRRRARISRRTWRGSAPSFPCCRGASTSAAARSPAASSRCWQSPAP